MFKRIMAIVVKEFIQLRRDRRTLAMVVAIPIIQMTLFGYALSTDIKNVALAVWDASQTVQSRELIQSFRNDEFFALRYYAASYEEVYSLLDSGKAKAVLVIPPDFADRLGRGEAASVQLLVDGSEPAAGTQALAEAGAITQARGLQLAGETRGGAIPKTPLTMLQRVLYNPQLKSAIFYLPGLVGAIVQMMTVMLTAFAIVREREMGTIEQLNVTPLSRGELIVAKLIPYVLISYIQITLVITGAVVVFGMPVNGSLLLLAGLTFFFIMFSLGIGILISTVSRTQFQAMQLSVLVMLPSIILSGFIFPVDSMPRGVQFFSYALPLTYFLRIVRGIVVKGVGMEYLWADTIILAVLGILSLVFAATRLRRTMG